jgi:hypothetical protein
MQHTDPDAGGADDDGRALCLLRTQTKTARSSPQISPPTHTHHHQFGTLHASMHERVARIYLQRTAGTAIS